MKTIYRSYSRGRREVLNGTVRFTKNKRSVRVTNKEATRLRQYAPKVRLELACEMNRVLVTFEVRMEFVHIFMNPSLVPASVYQHHKCDRFGLTARKNKKPTYSSSEMNRAVSTAMM